MTKKLEAKQKSKYSEYLPDHLKRRYEAGLRDPHLLHLSREIALMDVHMQMLVENIDREVLVEDDIAKDLIEEFPDLDPEMANNIAARVRTWMPEHFVDYRTFKRLESLVAQYENSITKRQIQKADSSLRLLFQMIREGRRSGDVWEDIHKSMDQRRRLVDQEQKRMTQAAQLITVDKVVLLLELTIESLRVSVDKYVKDTEIRDYIFVEAERVYSDLLSDDGDQAAYQIEMDGEG